MPRRLISPTSGSILVFRSSKKITDKTQTVCKHCKTRLPYTTSNTLNMMCHLKRHHNNKLLQTPATKRVKEGQTSIQRSFAATWSQSSAKAQEITRCIGVFIAKDMRPFSVVDNVGFRELVRVLEPRYHIPSRPHFSQEVVPALYCEAKAKVVDGLKKAENVAITTDGWTSRACQSYITVTAHVISTEWEMKSFVLQTRPLFESHTGTNIAEVLKAAIHEWELERAPHSTAVVTDNARNMEVAVREAGLSPHIKCFAHTLNLASQAGLNVSRVSRLLGRVRKVVAFFHRSATATAVLTEKQKMLEIASHKLIMDVVTRWNSSMDMLERYLEQQAAITAALLSTEVRKNGRQLDTLDSNDITDAEEIVNLLKPLKKATTVLSDEKSATLSLIVPLKSMIEQSMTLDEKDSKTIANMKAAILQNLSGRYTAVQDYLLESTALDPRFRSLPHLLPEQREEVFQRLMDKSNQLQQVCLSALLII